MRAEQTSRPFRIALGLILAGSALALGGAHVPVNIAVAVALWGVLLGVCLRTRSQRALFFNLPTGALALALGFTLLQLVPVPVGWLAHLAPKTHDIVSLDATRSFAPLSLDPPATAHEAVKLAGLLAAGLLALRLFGEGRRRRELLAWIGATGGLLVAVGLVHALLGWQRPYDAFGLPREVFVSTLVNPNHLAALCGLSAVVSVGLASVSKTRTRVAWIVNAALCGGATVLTLSRGGTLSLLAALGFLSLLLLIRSSSRRRGLLLVQVATLGALLLAGFIAYSQVVHELWTLSDERVFAKAAIWKPVPAMLNDFWAFGVGRGAFAFVYPHYLSEPTLFTFTHLENQWLQTLVDSGAIVGALLIGAVVASFVLMLVRARTDAAALGATAALVLLGVHNIGDFNLELTAVALPTVMLLVTGVGRPVSLRRASRSDDRPSASALAWPRGASLVFVGGLGMLLVVASPWAYAFEAERDARRLTVMLRGRELDAEVVRDAAAVVQRHPADYLLPLLVAQRLVSERAWAREALRWVNRALYLNPYYDGAHRLAGRALLQLGAREQAIIEYRLAAQAAPHRAASIARELWQATGGDALGVAALRPANPEARRQIANFLIARGAASAALVVLDELEAGAPLDLQVVRLRALAAAGRAHEALAAARRLIEQGATSAELYSAYAEAARLTGRAAEAATVLDAVIACDAGGAGPALFLARAQLAFAAGDPSAARRAASTLLERSADAAQQAQAQGLLAQAHALEGRKALALRHYQRARELDPRNVGYRLRIVELRHSIGDHAGARIELERAIADLGPSELLHKALERARQLEKKVEMSGNIWRK